MSCDMWFKCVLNKDQHSTKINSMEALEEVLNTMQEISSTDMESDPAPAESMAGGGQQAKRPPDPEPAEHKARPKLKQAPFRAEGPFPPSYPPPLPFPPSYPPPLKQTAKQRAEGQQVAPQQRAEVQQVVPPPRILAPPPHIIAVQWHPNPWRLTNGITASQLMEWVVCHGGTTKFQPHHFEGIFPWTPLGFPWTPTCFARGTP
jgi:hypothetical protein